MEPLEPLPRSATAMEFGSPILCALLIEGF